METLHAFQQHAQALEDWLIHLVAAAAGEMTAIADGRQQDVDICSQFILGVQALTRLRVYPGIPQHSQSLEHVTGMADCGCISNSVRWHARALYFLYADAVALRDIPAVRAIGEFRLDCTQAVLATVGLHCASGVDLCARCDPQGLLQHLLQDASSAEVHTLAFEALCRAQHYDHACRLYDVAKLGAVLPWARQLQFAEAGLEHGCASAVAAIMQQENAKALLVHSVLHGSFVLAAHDPALSVAVLLEHGMHTPAVELYCRFGGAMHVALPVRVKLDLCMHAFMLHAHWIVQMMLDREDDRGAALGEQWREHLAELSTTTAIWRC